MTIEDTACRGQWAHTKRDVLGIWATEPANSTECRIAQCAVLGTRGELAASRGAMSPLLSVSNSQNGREWASSDDSSLKSLP